MPGFIPYICSLAALASVTLGCGRSATDHNPQDGPRIVTLTPSTTEIVAMVAGPAAIVGVDEFSTYPAEITGRPRVGSFLQPSFEAIVALRPTLVVGDDVQVEALTALQGAGIPTISLKMHSVEDVLAGIRRVGAATGQDAAATSIAERLELAIDRARARGEARFPGGDKGPARPRVLAVIDRDPASLGNVVASGTGSFLDELLSIVGAENALASAGVRYPKLTSEEILRAAPTVIFDATHGGESSLGAWQELTAIPAVASGRVHVLAEPYFLSPSPRLDLALAALEALLE